MKQRTPYATEDLEELLRRPTLSVSEAAALCGVGATSLRQAMRRGEIDLQVISVGSRKVIPTAAVRRLLSADA
jgi:DNA-binding transcriptional LysR family regulator